VVIEPVKPITSTLYLCDNRFHTEILREQLKTGERKIGFVVIDGHSTSFHLLVGNVKETLLKFDVNLPKKHNKGGQSSTRFARIRDEKRGWYVSKVAEAFHKYFMDAGLLTVHSLIFAGCASFKYDLAKKLDSKVNEAILAFVDVQYGGEMGFQQAIELAATHLSKSKYVREQRILQEFFEQITIDGAYCFSASTTVYALEQGSIQTLIVSEDLPDIRYVLRSSEPIGEGEYEKKSRD